MEYKIRRQEVDLGRFTMEELRRRREAGDFSGDEYVQREGMPHWQPLDFVLRHGYRTLPPPLPKSVSRSGGIPAIVWIGLAVAIVLLVTGVVFIVNHARQIALNIAEPKFVEQSGPTAVDAASRPVVWTNNTLTFADVRRRGRGFRVREWLDGYEKRGQRNPECDAAAVRFLRTWISRNFGGPEATNGVSLEAEADKLAANPNCTDPLVLTVAALNSLNEFDAAGRFERALTAYPDSQHKAYPKFYASLMLASEPGYRPIRFRGLTNDILDLFTDCFADGSFTPDDQQDIAEIFMDGAGSGFFQRTTAQVCAVVRQAGPKYLWLALTLEGESEITTAWAARGGGFVNSVSEKGWDGFRSHLAAAHGDLTAAWNLQPGWPLAPERMIYVSLGDSGIDEMRAWFDRTVLAQIDYARAWSDFRWALRPRWYGNEASLLAFGTAALDTKRFDTDVPRKYIDCIYDVESEMQLPSGRHIFGRADIWPNLQRMYDGYLAALAQASDRDGWRTSYAVIAYFAKKYDVARTQLEALDWKPWPQNLTGWNVDLSLMSSEVAARTGSLGPEISAAEVLRETGDLSAALKLYSSLANRPGADIHTKEFIESRLPLVTTEQHLQTGGWVDFLPSADHDPNWIYSFGKAQRLPDGALEVESGPEGHMLFSRMRAGANFEVRGLFENVRSSNKNFQAGIVMGVPEFSGYNWYGFRIKRHDEEGGDLVALARGWSRQQIVQHITLNDVTNSFDFTFQNNRISASINGHEVFHRAAPPAAIVVPDNSYLLGIGAFSDSTNSVVRYRNIQVRQLH